MNIFKYQKRRYSGLNSTSIITKIKMFFEMSKTTKLNPAYKMSGVKKNVMFSLSEIKKLA
jgi:hypothetical protein